MFKFGKMIFPTFVLIAIFAIKAAALPTDPSPDFTQPSGQYQPSFEEKNKRDLIDITPAPPSPLSLREERPSLDYFYKYHHEFGLQVGALYDTEARGSEEHLHETVSVRYLYPDHKLQAWEWNGTFISDSTGTLSFSRRFIASQERFRPYTSLGVGVHVLADKALASFILWRQYQARAAVGFEWTTNLFGSEDHWRLETALALSPSSQQADVSLGYVWPF